MDGDIIFARESKRVKIDLGFRRSMWENNLALAKKQRINDKIKVNRRSAFGKPIGWPIEAFWREEPVAKVELIPEPEPAVGYS